MKSVFKSSEQSKEALKHHFAHKAAKKTGENEEVVQVKDKLKKCDFFQDMDENELSTWVEKLTVQEQLDLKFSHLYEIYDVVDRVVDEAAAQPQDEFHTSLELETTRTRARKRLEHVAQLPVYLYLTDLQSYGESGAVSRAAGTRLAATLTTLLDFEYGAHHAALMIGDVVLEWDDSSVVVPRHKDVQPVFRANLQRHHSHWLSRVSQAQMDMTTATAQHGSYGEQIKFMVDLNTEKKTLIDKLIEVIIQYNKYRYYHVFSRNCQHFVLDAMEALGLTEPPTFMGRMREYYETLRRGRRSELPNEFPSHENLDDYIMKNLQSLRPDDLEYFLCQYYGFHHKAVQEQGQDKPSESHCPIRTCQMKKLDERIAQDSVQLRIHNYTRV